MRKASSKPNENVCACVDSVTPGWLGGGSSHRVQKLPGVQNVKNEVASILHLV